MKSIHATQNLAPLIAKFRVSAHGILALNLVALASQFGAAASCARVYLEAKHALYCLK